MARKSKEEKRMEAAVSAAFNQHGSNIQFSIMDLPKIHAAGMAAGRAGQDIEAAVIEAIGKYRIAA